MEFSIRQIADVVVAAPTGRIDSRHGERARAGDCCRWWTAPRDAMRVVVIDMDHVEYISSMGLRVLMVAAKQARAASVFGLRSHHCRPSSRRSSRSVASMPCSTSTHRCGARSSPFRHLHWQSSTQRSDGRRHEARSASGEHAGRFRCRSPQRDVRARIATALRAASGRGLKSEQEIDDYMGDAAVRGRRNLRRSYVLRRDRNRWPRIRSMRSRQRRAPVRTGRNCASRPDKAADLPRVPVPRSLGPHHGAAVLHACVHSGQPDLLLRRPCRARSGAAPPDGSALVSGGLLAAAGRHRVRAAWSRESAAPWRA